MPDYTQGLIYKINVGDDIYVGSTCNFDDRKKNHKKKVYNEKSKQYNRKLYQTIRENNGQFNMELLHHFPCNNKTELHQEEQRVLNELNPELNIYRAYQSVEERRAYNKRFRENNREKIKQQSKIYREANKEKIKQQSKIYIENNKEKLKEQQRKTKTKRVKCPYCSKEMNNGCLTDHKKKHCKSIERKQVAWVGMTQAFQS